MRLTINSDTLFDLLFQIPSFMFPETLKKAIIVRPPKIFYIIWSIVKLFLDARTVAKITVLGSNEDPLAEIEKYVHRNHIPDWLGGDMITRGTRKETPQLWHEGWYDGVQEDGVTRKGTLSVGGNVPEEERTHSVKECSNLEMDFGDISHPKYHVN